MSLHHIGIATVQGQQKSNYARVGSQSATSRPKSCSKARAPDSSTGTGKDEHGNFEIVAPPSDAASAAESAKKPTRVLRNVYP